MTKLVVDGRVLEVEAGRSLLEICLSNDIYIPHLCYLEGEKRPGASCRLCFVEVEGRIVPACATRVDGPMNVKTDTPEVRALQRSALRLLLSVHEVDCAHCPANRQCGLQDVARFLKVGLKAKGLESFRKQPAVVQGHPCIDHYPNRCVLCGRCVRLCRTLDGRPQMNFTRRGFETVISFFGANPEKLPSCDDCRTCVKVCPVGALVWKKPAT